jgi:hypothetical protein
MSSSCSRAEPLWRLGAQDRAPLFPAILGKTPYPDIANAPPEPSPARGAHRKLLYAAADLLGGDD